MKLLKKSTVNNDLAFQKKQQIDEGMALAKKIDALRQTLLALETQHSQYIAGMQEELTKKIENLTKEIESKEIELESKKQQIRDLDTPLDTPLDVQADISDVIWAKLSLKSEDIDKKIEFANKKEQDLSLKTIELEREEERIKLEGEVSKINFETSREEKIKADRILSSIEQKNAESERAMEQKTKSILSREAQIASKERELEIEKNTLQAKEIELIEKERAVNDKYQTLLRIEKYK